MDLRDNPNIIGATRGLWEGQHERLDELNGRISSRQFPDVPLQANFNMRPVATKYALFPIIDRRAEPTVPIQKRPVYNQYNSFSPATSKGPVATYLANVDLETVLQNRNVSLQKGAEQGVYVPHSSSDLYGFGAVGRQEQMGDRSLLFNRPPLSTKISEVAEKVGLDRFHNNTRVQLRGL